MAVSAIGMKTTMNDASIATRKQLLHDAAQRVDITTGVDGMDLYRKFGRGVAACASHGAIHIVAIVVGKAEVDEAYIVIRSGDEDIVGLEVIVQHTGLVEIGGS